VRVERQGLPGARGWGQPIGESWRELDPYFSTYRQYIDERNGTCKSTSCRDDFYDVILELDEPSHLRLIKSILDEVEPYAAEGVAALRQSLGGVAYGPAAVVPPDAWRADRLNGSLAVIDTSITTGNYERALTLSYTCLLRSASMTPHPSIERQATEPPRIVDDRQFSPAHLTARDAATKQKICYSLKIY
jgi:hypothetical protein